MPFDFSRSGFRESFGQRKIGQHLFISALTTLGAFLFLGLPFAMVWEFLALVFFALTIDEFIWLKL